MTAPVLTASDVRRFRHAQTDLKCAIYELSYIREPHLQGAVENIRQRLAMALKEIEQS